MATRVLNVATAVAVAAGVMMGSAAPASADNGCPVGWRWGTTPRNLAHNKDVISLLPANSIQDPTGTAIFWPGYQGKQSVYGSYKATVQSDQAVTVRFTWNNPDPALVQYMPDVLLGPVNPDGKFTLRTEASPDEGVDWSGGQLECLLGG